MIADTILQFWHAYIEPHRWPLAAGAAIFGIPMAYWFVREWRKPVLPGSEAETQEMDVVR